MIVPLRFQSAPRRAGHVHTSSGSFGLPSSSFLSRPLAEKSTNRPVADQATNSPCSVPARGWPEAASRGRSQRKDLPPETAVEISRRPSGEMPNGERNVVFSGGGIV